MDRPTAKIRLSQVAWFVLLWAASVASLAAVAAAIRLLLRV